MPSRKVNSRRHHRKNKHRGGAGYDTTGSWGNAVYGTPQSSAQNAGNEIHMNQPSTGGGESNSPESSELVGGNLLNVVAVPAVLMAANQLYGKRKTFNKKNSFKRKFRRFRGTRRNRK